MILVVIASSSSDYTPLLAVSPDKKKAPLLNDDLPPIWTRCQGGE